MNDGPLAHHLPGVLHTDLPHGPALPLVFDSPHSGDTYPDDFQSALSLEKLRTTADLHVEALFQDTPAQGATLLQALFPRAYIDPNRSPWDIDESLLGGTWPGLVRPSDKSRRGKGLLRSKVQGNQIYTRLLHPRDVQRRLYGYYRPYHAALKQRLEALHKAHGQSWHINCHSWTPPKLGRDGNPIRHIDFCLGDLDGKTCDPALTELFAETLEKEGYVVRINRPFRGMELIRRHGAPHNARHSLQIEINRHLYMHPDTLLRKEREFAHLRLVLNRLTTALCDLVKKNL